jgi:hypothetical protein
LDIALASDSHDNVPVMGRFVEYCRKEGVGAIVFAGDIVAPFTAKALVAFAGPVYAVYGNNDGERRGLAGVLAGIADGPRTVEIAGRRIVVIHDRTKLGDVGADVDVIVSGHTHQLSVGTGRPLEINPGELGGWLTGKKTFCLLRLEDLSVRVVEM